MTKVHLSGICGTAMATLAAMLKRRGYHVQGSDQGVYPPMSDFLAAERITAFSGYDARHVTGDLDLVIVGNAISRGNAELEEVLDRKIRYCSLPEAIREHFLWGSRSIVIAGTHGKTTTTALAGWVLTDAGVDPSVLVGGIAGNFGAGGSSYRMGQGRDFVIEGDEYDSAFFDKTAKFLKYLPDIAIVNNIEFDHADIYPDVAAVELAFKRLAVLVPRNGVLLLGSDSPRAAALAAHAASPVETFGVDGDPTWKATDLAVGPGGTRFKVHRQGTLLGTFEVPLLGAHNVRNALAGVAVCATLGIDAKAFEGADQVVVAPVFRSKVAEDRRLSPDALVADLVARGRSARAASSTADIVDTVAREAAAGDLVVVMSNGGFDGVHEKLLGALRLRDGSGGQVG